MAVSPGCNCNVRVGVRVRPLPSCSQAVAGPSASRGGPGGSVVSVHKDERSISIGTRSFKYDMVFDERITQSEMYSSVGAKGMLEGVFDGYNATVRLFGDEDASAEATPHTHQTPLN